MRSSFAFIVTAPEGVLQACFDLKPGHCYGPGDVQVETGAGQLVAAHTLTVRATRLPTEVEFRELAARAATRTADDSPNQFKRLLNLLIPF